MSDRADKRRGYDKKRRELLPWRKWYFTKAWRTRRKRQLDKVPYCQPCARAGRTRIATVANHKEPHRGDQKLFFSGELESACKHCHDSQIQQFEREGFSREIGDDGWPTDPAHPFNRGPSGLRGAAAGGLAARPAPATTADARKTKPRAG